MTTEQVLNAASASRVLVDLGRRAPTPPGIILLHEGMGLVAKRLEHIPNSDPPRRANRMTLAIGTGGEYLLRQAFRRSISLHLACRSNLLV